ncbi:MAG: serine/threonine protein kinase [Planctomycetes bacterium]|nr:serine/threonine protein kinase [Planctomycetota bacterium]
MIPGHAVEGELGRGGFGRVLRARNLATGAVRAVKVLEHVAGPEEVERFRREGELLARLGGPGVVPVHEAGVDRGRLYLIMDLMPGGSLRARMAPGQPWPWREAAALVAALARALAPAHAAGIVHRDLKPENVLFDEQGAPRVADFGCARDATARSLTETGVALGTPSYMAPEQLGGERVDARADVWSLGVLLHELLAGERPFAGRTPLELLHRTLTGARAPLDRRLGVPPALEAVLDRSLALDREARPADGAALAGALEAATTARAGGRRLPARLAATGVAAALVVGALALFAATSTTTTPDLARPPTATPAPATPSATGVTALAADPRVPVAEVEEAARAALERGAGESAEDLARAAAARPGSRALATLAGAALLAAGERAPALELLAAGDPPGVGLGELVRATDALLAWLLESEEQPKRELPPPPELVHPLARVAGSPFAARAADALAPLTALAVARASALGENENSVLRPGWRRLAPLAGERRLPAELRGGLALFGDVQDGDLRIKLGKEVAGANPLLAASLLLSGVHLGGAVDADDGALEEALRLARAPEGVAPSRWRARLIAETAGTLAERTHRRSADQAPVAVDDRILRLAALHLEAFLAGEALPADASWRQRPTRSLLEALGHVPPLGQVVVERLAPLPGGAAERRLVLAAAQVGAAGVDPERLLADALADAAEAPRDVRVAAATSAARRQFNFAVSVGAADTLAAARAARLTLTAFDLTEARGEAQLPLARLFAQVVDWALQGARPPLALPPVDGRPPPSTAEDEYLRALWLAALGRVDEADAALAAARRRGAPDHTLGDRVEWTLARAAGRR